MKKIEKFLQENSNDEMVNFNKKLISTKYKIYGVKIPLIRKEAKELFESGVTFDFVEPNSLEEILLKGILLSYEKDVKVVLQKLESLLPYFDNWCSVDVIVPSLKKLKGKSEAFELFKKLCQSEEEFVCRTGIIGLMRHFITEPYFDQTLEIISKIDSDKYYIKMASAWAFCDFFIKNFEKTAVFYKKITNSDIKKKCAQKCRDSFRLTKEQKDIVTNLSK